MLMSQLTRRILPLVLIAAVACCGATARAQGSAIQYVRLGYEQVDLLCALLPEMLKAWRDPAKSDNRALIEQRGAEITGALATMAMSGAIDVHLRPNPSTNEPFKRLASTTQDPQSLGVLLLAVLRQAKSAKPPHSVTDIQDARTRVAAYAAYCTFDGIASLQTRITR